MCGEHMMRVLKVAAFLVCLSTTSALSADIKSCVEPSIRRVSEQDFSRCERLASTGNLGVQQRSRIFLNLAFTTFFRPSLKVDGEETKFRNVIRFANASIAADPANGDAYLALADFLEMRYQLQEAVSVLSDGLKKAPTDLRIVAEYAAHTASPATKVAIVEMCNKVTSSTEVDPNSYFACGKAAVGAGSNDLAELYLFKAISVEANPAARFNDVQFGSPEKMYFNLMMKAGRGKDAAKVLESAYLKRRGVNYFEWQLLAEMQAQVANYDQAAQYYGIAASNAFPSLQFSLKLNQVIFLAKAGKTQDSLHLADILFLSSTQQQVLRLQVMLKNGSQKDLTINGKFDEQTKRALSACIRERGCFGDFKGQLI
jgi:hypothetical protein